MKIILKDLSVNFPVLDFEKSLRKKILNSPLNGKLNSKNKVVNVTALSNINLELYQGDRIGLMGNNGAGKSTLLRVISGCYEPSSGSILVSGRVNSLIDISAGFDLRATGLENIALRAQVLGYSSDELKQRIDKIIDFSDLGDFIKMPLRTYSSGMQLRLAFSVSMFAPTDILLMDEWLSVGDQGFQVKAESMIMQLVNNSKILVIASHSQDVINKLCNKVFILDNGVLKEK